jgi:hypothetical protein
MQQGIQEIQLVFWLPDNRKCDLTNKAESVMDLLVDCEVIEDDCWQVIPKLYLNAAGIDKEDPRVEIYIQKSDRDQGPGKDTPKTNCSPRSGRKGSTKARTKKS